MTTDKTKTMARNALKMAGVIRYDENCHTLIDVSLLMALPDCELLTCRNVGRVTLEAIRELKKNYWCPVNVFNALFLLILIMDKPPSA